MAEVDLEKKIKREKAERLANRMFDELSYSVMANEYTLADTFNNFLARFLDDKIDIWTLTVAANMMEANPALDKSFVKDEVFVAINIEKYLWDENQSKVDESVDKLKKYFEI